MSKDENRQMIKAFTLAGTIGLNIAATIAVGLFSGKWLDEYFNTAPFATVSGIILGMVAGLWSAYKRIMDKS